jgi:hypothetical protein
MEQTGRNLSAACPEEPAPQANRLEALEQRDRTEAQVELLRARLVYHQQATEETAKEFERSWTRRNRNRSKSC